MGARPARYAPPPAETSGSRVWFNGQCMTGPDYRGSLLTLLLALLIFVTECVVSFPWLLLNRPAVAVPLIVVIVVSFSITVLSAYLASTTDPGIIPRANDRPHSIKMFPAVRERTVNFRGRPATLKYCETCQIWRPPRSSHCATCNNCVRRFDHHCPWLGNDVGLRNYRSYFTFVVSASVSSAIAIACSVMTLHWTSAHFREEFPEETYASSIRRALTSGGTAANIVLVLLSSLALAFTLGLTGFHIYLMLHNVTTAESFKKRARNSLLPSDDLRGCAALAFLQCTARQESAVTEGYVGPAYPEEGELERLVDQQVAEEMARQKSSSVHAHGTQALAQTHSHVPAQVPKRTGSTRSGIVTIPVTAPVAVHYAGSTASPARAARNL